MRSRSTWIAGATACAAALTLVVLRMGPSDAARTQTSSLASAAALASSLRAPEDIAFDANGNAFISEFDGHQVDRIDSNGMLRVVSGTGTAGYSGDGRPAIDAQLNAPTGLLVLANGDLLIADHHNHCLRRVDARANISSVVGTCTKHGTKGDGGLATLAKLNDPIGIAQDSLGNLYIADEQNALVRRVDTNGVITTFAGGGNQPIAGAPDGTLATRLKLSHTSYVVTDATGNVFISDFWANVVIRVAPSGRMSRVAGTGVAGFSGDGGPATSAQLNFPTGLAFDGRGRLFVSDAENNRVRMIDRNGIISTVAGTGDAAYAGDGGPAMRAAFSAPAGLAFDVHGNLWIADQGNNVVRMVDRGGIVSLVAGQPA
jgi:sugar lactone lactonase YvrE